MCKKCPSNDVFIKKRDLCLRCYHKTMRQKRIERHGRPYGKKPSRRRIIRNLMDKYGLEIIRDINQTRLHPCTSLTSIANKYGFTRERARQIYTALFREGYRQKELEKNKVVREADICCINDPRRKVADYKRGSCKFVSATAEKHVFIKAKKLGFNVDIPCQASMGLKINGHAVKAKSSTHIIRPVPKCPDSAYCHYEITIKEKTKFDYFALWNTKLKKFFIVPNDFINNGKPKSIFLPIKRTKNNMSNRYWKYEENWKQLDERN